MAVSGSWQPDAPAALLVGLFADPGRARQLLPGQWDLALQQAQNTGLAGRLADVLREGGAWASLSQRVKHVLTMAEMHTARFRQEAQWEAKSMRAVMRDIGQPLILLKGGAYVVRDLAAGRGRVLSDIDILVPRERLQAVENIFLARGWRPMKQNEYDDHYYRDWGHELPPMQHMRRGTVVDIHHTILPPTARYTVDGTLLLAAAQGIPGEPDMMTLQPVDMMLHSVAHLFADGAMDNGLRDLIDQQALLRQFGTEPGFWRMLLLRADELGLQRPLFYALDALERHLEYPVPMEVMAEVSTWAPSGWGLLRPLFARCLRPRHSSVEGPDVAAARFAIYLRSHYLRMPMTMLIPHLTRKAVRRWRQDEAAA